jgi:hypothetical protein
LYFFLPFFPRFPFFLAFSLSLFFNVALCFIFLLSVSFFLFPFCSFIPSFISLFYLCYPFSLHLFLLALLPSFRHEVFCKVRTWLPGVKVSAGKGERSLKCLPAHYQLVPVNLLPFQH